MWREESRKWASNMLSVKEEETSQVPGELWEERKQMTGGKRRQEDAIVIVANPGVCVSS